MRGVRVPVVACPFGTYWELCWYPPAPFCFLLYCQADFLVHFLDVSGEELSKTVNPAAPVVDLRISLSMTPARGGVGRGALAPSISVPRLRALLELSLRSSAAASDPYKVSGCV